MDLHEISLESFSQSASVIEKVRVDSSDCSLTSQNIIDISKPLSTSKSDQLSLDGSSISFECISNESFSNLGKQNKKSLLDHQADLKKLTFNLKRLQFNTSNPACEVIAKKDLFSCQEATKKRKVNNGQERKQSVYRINGNKKNVYGRAINQEVCVFPRRKAEPKSTDDIFNTQIPEVDDYLFGTIQFDSKIDQAVKKAILKKESKKQGNYEAQGKYKAGIFVDPDSTEAYNNWALGSENKYSALTQASYSQGLALYRQGKCQSAIKRFKQALYYNPSFYEAYYHWAIILDTLGKYNESILIYKKTLELNPKFVEAHYRLGLAFYRTERYQEAKASLEAATSLSSATAQLSFVNEDKVNEETSEKESSVEDGLSKSNSISEEDYSIIDKEDSFEILRKINPRFSNINLNKETLSDSQSEFELLLDAINRMIIESRVPTEHLESNSNHETIRDIVKGFNADPVQNMAYSLHAIILAKQGVFKEAIEKFEKTTSLDPSQCDACFYWGLAYCDQGKYEKAKETYRRAIALNTNYGQRYKDWVLGVKKEEKFIELLQRYMKVILLDIK